MSQLSKLREAIQKLEEAEEALLNARNTFDGDREFRILGEKSVEVSEIAYHVSKLLKTTELKLIELLKSPQEGEGRSSE